MGPGADAANGFASAARCACVAALRGAAGATETRVGPD